MFGPRGADAEGRLCGLWSPEIMAGVVQKLWRVVVMVLGEAETSTKEAVLAARRAWRSKVELRRLK